MYLTFVLYETGSNNFKTLTIIPQKDLVKVSYLSTSSGLDANFSLVSKHSVDFISVMTTRVTELVKCANGYGVSGEYDTLKFFQTFSGWCINVFESSKDRSYDFYAKKIGEDIPFLLQNESNQFKLLALKTPTVSESSGSRLT